MMILLDISSTLSLVKLHNILSPVLFIVRIPQLRFIVPVPNIVGFRKSLHAHVQVCPTPILCDLWGHLSYLFNSSLVTGSRSHKLVTSDVSHILWLYYNDSVSAEAMLSEVGAS